MHAYVAGLHADVLQVQMWIVFEPIRDIHTTCSGYILPRRTGWCVSHLRVRLACVTTARITAGVPDALEDYCS
jgi:hypothetical protein